MTVLWLFCLHTMEANEQANGIIEKPNSKGHFLTKF